MKLPAEEEEEGGLCWLLSTSSIYFCDKFSIRTSPQRIVSTIYRYANIVWFSKYRWNIVIAFFFTISHDIFRPFFTNFYLFLLIKNSIFGNTLWFQSSKNDFICIIQTFFTNFTLLAWNLWKIAGNATLNVAFPAIYAHFYQIGNIASIVWLSYQNLKYRVISCGP